MADSTKKPRKTYQETGKWPQGGGVAPGKGDPGNGKPAKSEPPKRK
jgi:hypothetical protein